MKRGSLVAAAAFVFFATYLAALIATMPAGLAWRWLEPNLGLPGTLQVDGWSGSLWQGQANGVALQGRPLGSISWSLEPAALATGRFGVRVGLAAGSERLDGRLRVGRGDMAIHRLHGTVRAGRLQEWLDLPLVLEGGIHVDLAALTLDSGQGVTEADGAVLWSGAAAGLPRAFPLGEYRATLEAREGSVLARIESAPDSPLEVSGIAGWMPIDNSYRVDLEARLDSSADAALRGALDSLARSQPDGSYRIVLGGASRAPDRRAAPPTVRAYDTEELDAVTPP